MAVYRPVYTVVSFYLHVSLFMFGIIVTATAARSLYARYPRTVCVGTKSIIFGCTSYPGLQLIEVRFSVFAGVFTFLFAGVLNIVLSFFSKGPVVIVITVADFLAAWFLLGSGIGTARAIEFYRDKHDGKIIACCAFSFIAMAVAATVFAFDLIELLVLRQHGAFTSSHREHQMTVAALKSSPFRSHSTVTYSKDQPANPSSTILEHSESAAKPVGTEPHVNEYVDATATGIPEAQHEPKPAV